MLGNLSTYNSAVVRPAEMDCRKTIALERGTITREGAQSHERGAITRKRAQSHERGHNHTRGGTITREGAQSHEREHNHTRGGTKKKFLTSIKVSVEN